MSIITTRPDGKKEIMIGIDLGTTNSAVAIYDNGEPKIYENLLGRRTTPSVIALKKTRNKATKEITEEWIVGEAAKNQAAANHLNTFYGVKRLIGRRFDDPEVAKMQALASYKIVAGPNGDAWVEVNGKAKAPAEISAMVLRELRTAVIKTLGLEEDDKNGNLVVNAVITVPAYFNDAQRQATKDAGKIAALDVKRIVNEPTSAALAYGMDKQKDCKIAVFDLGGGTFDVSILSVDVSDAGNTIEVLATNGDTFLGGENFDEIVTEHLVEALNDEHGTDIDLKDKDSKDKHAQAIQRLREGAERAKIALSIQDSSTINIPFLMKDAVGEDVNFEYTLTRKQLEKLLKPLIEKTLKPCENALADAGKKLRGENAPPLKPTELDEIILVGGQTRMPLVIETVKKYFGKDPKRDVNPDEIVAMGAAAQGAVLQGKIDNVLLLDVIPLSIGIRGFGDVMNIVVPRNASIPGSFKDEYGNPEKNAPGIRIQVYQGERPKASDNKKLGEFILGSLDPRSPDRLPPADVGKLKIEVSFNIDADGVLNVSARIPETGREAKITLKANGGLSEQEVARMLQEAEANAEKDKLFRLSLVAKPNAEAALADAEADAIQDDKGEFVMEYFRTAPEELKKEFFETVKELTAAKDRNDVVVMTEKTELLNSVRARIGEAFNNAAKPSAETPAADTPTPDASPEAPAKDAPKGPQP